VFHWIDQQKFLAEARRTIRPGGYLVFIGHGFAGEIKENPAFKKWAWEVYPKRYPPPPRNSGSLDSDASLDEFEHCFTERFLHHIDLTAEKLVAYLLTQSNVVAAVERGGEKIESVREFLLQEVHAFFANGNSANRACLFHGHVTAQRRTG
jgi:SAM-dependent methyltransferase